MFIEGEHTMFNIPIAAQSFQPAESLAATEGAQSQDFVATLLASLPSLTEPSATELADDMLDRAVAYDKSQPSFAADLRATVFREDADAVA
jgi:hypothetical protein